MISKILILLCTILAFIHINKLYERNQELDVEYETVKLEKEKLYIQNVEKNLEIYELSQELNACKASLLDRNVP
jgi:hypothetical protein